MSNTTNTTTRTDSFYESQTLDVATVSKQLGVSRATVLRWIRANKIEGFFRIGSKWLIRKSDFDGFINRRINNSKQL